MKKQTKSKKKFFYWIPFLLLLILAVFALILIGTGGELSFSPKEAASELSALGITDETGMLVTETPLPEDYPKLPREYFENENETDGVILGGTVIVLIILIGTLVFIRKDNHKKRNAK